MLALTAETTAETYSTDWNGSYAGLSPRKLHEYYSPVRIKPSRDQPYVSSATGTADSYAIVVKATDGNTFTLDRQPNFDVVRRWRGHMGPRCASRGQRGW